MRVFEITIFGLITVSLHLGITKGSQGTHSSSTSTKYPGYSSSRVC